MSAAMGRLRLVSDRSDVGLEEGARNAPTAPFAVVSHCVPPSRFGQPRVLYRLLREFPADGYGLLSTTQYDRDAPKADQDGPWLDAAYVHLDLGFPWRQISQRPGLAGVPRAAYTLAMLTVALRRRARQIETVVRDRGYRAIVACSGDPVDLPACAIAARRTGVFFVGYMFDDYGTQYKNLPGYRQFTSLGDRFVARRADRIIVPNERSASEYAARHNVQPAIVHNPHAGVYGDGADRPLSADAVRIVYTGAVYHVHDDAFTRLLQVVDESAQSLSLHLYSSVDTRLYPVFRHSANVHHHGHVADDEAFRVQSAADILFLPLAFHSAVPEVVRTALPGKFPEYLASGRPILLHAPADSFVAQYCRRHQCAAVVDEPDIRALGRALRKLTTQPEFRRTVVAAALHRARTDFDPAAAARNFSAVLRGMSG